MATTPYFLWPAQASSADSDIAGFGFGSPEETATDHMALVAPGLSEAVARPRLSRQTSGSGKQQQAGGGAKKPPQRGLGVAELERLRCGGDPLRDLNAAAAAAAAMGDAAAANGQGKSVLLHHHHDHDHLPVFDATTGSRYYSPLLVQPPPPAPPAPPAPVCYVQSRSAGGQCVAPEQQYFMDRWGRMGGFVPAGSAGSGHQPQLLPAPAPENPSSQSTIWRPTSSSASCLHTGHRCDLCSRTMRALTARGSRTPAATATTTLPDCSIYDDLAAAMANARKEKGEGGWFLAREGKKEVREIEFFPASTTNHAGGVGPDKSEFATTRWSTAPFPSPSGGGCAPPLDLSLKL